MSATPGATEGVPPAGVAAPSTQEGPASQAAPVSGAGETAPAPTAAQTLLLVTREQGAALAFVEKLAAEFSAASGWRVQVMPKDLAFLRADAELAALAGQAPDLIWTVNSDIGPLAAAEVIQPAAGVFARANFVASAAGGGSIDGTQWAVPVTAGNHLLLIYNRKLLPVPPRTTDELLGLPKPEGADVVLATHRSDPLWLAPWLHGFGGAVFGAEGRPSLDTPAMVGALRLLKELREKNVLVSEPDFGASAAHFKAGKVAMIIDGEWALQDYVAANSEAIEVAVAPWPVIPATNRPAAPFVSGNYLMLSKSLSGRRLEAAQAFMSYVTSPDVQIRVATELQRLPALLSSLNAEPVQRSPVLRAAAEALAQGQPMPANAAMRAVWDAMAPGMAAVLAGEQEPEEAAQAMQSSAEAAIGP